MSLRVLIALALVVLCGCGAESSAPTTPAPFQGTVTVEALGRPLALPVSGVTSPDARDFDVRASFGQVPLELRVRGDTAYVKVPERSHERKPWGAARLAGVPWLDAFVGAIRADIGAMRRDRVAALAAVPAADQTFDATQMLGSVGPATARAQ